MKSMSSKIVSSLLLLGLSPLALAAGPTLTPALLEKGKVSYTTNCMACHGEKGDGNGPAGSMMNPKPRNLITEKFKKGDKLDQVFKTLTSGLPNTSMVAFGHLNDEERWALSHYVLSLRKPKK